MHVFIVKTTICQENMSTPYCLIRTPTQLTFSRSTSLIRSCTSLYSFSGEKQYNMEEFLAIVRQVVKERDTGSYKEFMEAFKSFDREGQGYISLGEARHVLTSMGKKGSTRGCN